jgi:hypothetical protein
MGSCGVLKAVCELTIPLKVHIIPKCLTYQEIEEPVAAGIPRRDPVHEGWNR